MTYANQKDVVVDMEKAMEVRFKKFDGELSVKIFLRIQKMLLKMDLLWSLVMFLML